MVHSPYADIQDRPAFTYCSKCGAEIYLEDFCYMHNALTLCEQCGSDGIDIPTTGYELQQYYNTMYGGTHE